MDNELNSSRWAFLEGRRENNICAVDSSIGVVVVVDGDDDDVSDDNVGLLEANLPLALGVFVELVVVVVVDDGRHLER